MARLITHLIVLLFLTSCLSQVEGKRKGHKRTHKVKHKNYLLEVKTVGGRAKVEGKDHQRDPEGRDYQNKATEKGSNNTEEEEDIYQEYQSGSEEDGQISTIAVTKSITQFSGKTSTLLTNMQI